MLSTFPCLVLPPSPFFLPESTFMSTPKPISGSGCRKELMATTKQMGGGENLMAMEYPHTGLLREEALLGCFLLLWQPPSACAHTEAHMPLCNPSSPPSATEPLPRGSGFGGILSALIIDFWFSGETKRGNVSTSLNKKQRDTWQSLGTCSWPVLTLGTP